MCVYIHMRTYEGSLSIFVFIYMYVGMYVCMCVCTYGVHTHIYPSLVPLVGRIVSIKS